MQIKTSKQENKQNKTVIEFAHLKQNSKADFLQFLLKNNISFERSQAYNNKGDYVAKVTIKNYNQQNKQNKTQKQINRCKENKANTGSKVDKINLKSARAQTPNKQLIKTKTKQKVISPLQQRKQNISILKGSSQFKNQKSSKKHVAQSNKHYINKSVKTTQFYVNDHSLNMSRQKSKLKNNRNITQFNKTFMQQQKKYKKQQKSRVQEYKTHETYKSIKINKKVQPTKDKQKIAAINSQIKKKTQQQKQIFDLASKYLKVFQLKLQGQRPIKWQILQVFTTIEQIYNELFSRNTQILAQKGVNYRDTHSINNFSKFIKQVFFNKFRNEKLSNSNLINFLYSLSYYLQNQKKIFRYPNNIVKQIKKNQSLTSSQIFLQTFQDFICEIYQFQDLLFYLFVRNIILKPLNNEMKRKSQTKKQKICTFEKDVLLTFRDVIKVLNIIFDQDTQLVDEYRIVLLTRINSNIKLADQSNLDMQKQLKISCPQFTQILIENYKSKRIILQKSMQNDKQNKPEAFMTSYSQNEQNNVGISLRTTNGKQKQKFQNQAHKIKFNLQEHQTQQLTFGQQTQENLQKYFGSQVNMNFNKQFWESSAETDIFQNFKSDSIQVMLFDKMRKKVIQFVNILIQNRSQYNSIQHKIINKQNQMIDSVRKNYVMEQIMKKSINLLGSIVDMNKLKWFEQLKLLNPHQNDIQQVENLQLLYRQLKSHPDAQKIGKLCKDILTVSQFTVAVQKLIYQ